LNKIHKILRKSKKPMTFKQLLVQSGDDPKKLKKDLKELIRQNKAERFRNGTYVARTAPEDIGGKVDLHPDGYGFLSVDTGGRDLFIPKNKMNGALHGDRVRVAVEKFRGKSEGRVIEITERSSQVIVGRVENLAGIMRVVPISKKFNNYIYLTKKTEQYPNDRIVMVELTSFPTERSAARGKITKDLGDINDTRIEDEIVLNRYNIEREYPEEALRYVEESSDRLLKNAGKRTDFRQLTTVTIDGETAKDFDDAISIETDGNEYVLYVHIADVSHFVEPNSVLDREAIRRGTSFYFPEFAVPMLPEKLSNGLCSLKPDEDRLSLTAKITYFKDGKRKKSEFYRSVIKSDKRLTYDYVHDVLNGTVKEKNKNVLELINNSKVLASKIMKRRTKEGMLDFDFPETTFELDKDGAVTAVKPAERHISHRIIEHFMIEANEVVSEFLEKSYSKSVYRIHDKPDPMKIQEFLDTAETFGVSLSIKEVTPKEVSFISRAVNESEYKDILGPALVRTMAKAEYSTNNIGHFGLASESYTHFTSPIRRYPDLMVHRLLCNKLFGTQYHSDTGLDESCKLSTENEQRAVNAERDIDRFKKLKFLAKHQDEPFGAVIMNVGNFGLSIYIESIMLKGTIPLESIPGDVYQFIKKAQMVKGRVTGKMFRAADKMEVMVERIDMDFQEAYFYPV